MPRPPKYNSVFKDGRLWENTFEKGKSNTSVLQAAFATSPQYDKFDRQTLLDVANDKLVPKTHAQEGELKDFPNGVKFDYTGTNQSGPPDYNKMKQDIGGVHKSAILSPFTPNIKGSDGNGVVPATTSPKPEDALPMYKERKDRVVNPVDSSKTLGKTVKLGEKLSPGASGAKSRGTQIDG